MKILYCGDVIGRSGREALLTFLPRLKQDFSLDLIIVNGENAAQGFGITEGICRELFAAGVDVITTGNHVWGQREIMGYLPKEPRLLRPLNYPKSAPGRGWTKVQARSGKSAVVMNVMGRVFMDPLDDPFQGVASVLEGMPLGLEKGAGIAAMILDIHGEATSEKMAMGHFCDGRVSLVVGSHSHIPTADAQILPHGTGYQSDAGMCGDYNSVIGMVKEAPLHRFLHRTPGPRMTPALGQGTLCGVYVETNDATGLCSYISPVIQGPRLKSVMPFSEEKTEREKL